MGTRGNAFDNVACESFIATLKRELIDRQCRPMGAAAARSSTNPTMSLGREELATA